MGASVSREGSPEKKRSTGEDPRSPTKGISRTPMRAAADPRSPSQGFQRTPIQVPLARRELVGVRTELDYENGPPQGKQPLHGDSSTRSPLSARN